MASNQSFSQFGMEAMNSYFMATTNTMVSAADASMPPDHHGGSFSFAGDHSAGGAATTEDIGAHFTANNTMLASFASQLFGPAPHDIGARMAPVEKISDGFGASETYYLAGLAEAGYFAFPPAAASELSLSLCSGLTHANRVDTELAQVHPHFSGEVLSRSRYAQAAQQVLSEVVSRVLDGFGVADAADSVASGIDSDARPSLASSCSTAALSAVSSNQLMASAEEHSHDGGGGGGEGARCGEAHERLRSELMKMLQLMDQKYNQCLDEIQNTTTKFNSLMPSANGGGVCAPFAHRAVSVMYRGLRRRISGEIMVVSRRHGRGDQESPSTVGERERKWEATFIQKHWALQQLRRGEAQQCWRPQRGLPEKSVAVLKAWMFENFLRPYPKDNEKDILAARSGLSRSQVSNWFINARVRLWKPMIEEMYEELNKTSGAGAENSAMEHLSNQDLLS